MGTQTQLPSERPPSRGGSVSAWHDARRHTLLREHPSLRTLQGHDARTALWVLGLVALQLGVAWSLRGAGYGVALVAGALGGAFVAHALGVLIHECAHNLVFRGNAANKLLSLLANVPLVFPAALDFRYQHLRHHKHLGELDGRDTQSPTTAEVRFVQRTPGGRPLWWVFGPMVNTFFRDPSLRTPFDRWVAANMLAQSAAMAAVALLAGGPSLAYLAAAGFFAFGLHPVGFRRHGEHLLGKSGQPTNSYYGLLNWLSFNVGYHVEHHDLPAVPWSRLPAVRALAAESYDALFAVRSWTGLMVNYLLHRDPGAANYVGLESLAHDDHDGAHHHHA